MTSDAYGQRGTHCLPQVTKLPSGKPQGSWVPNPDTVGLAAQQSGRTHILLSPTRGLPDNSLKPGRSKCVFVRDLLSECGFVHWFCAHNLQSRCLRIQAVKALADWLQAAVWLGLVFTARSPKGEDYMSFQVQRKFPPIISCHPHPFSKETMKRNQETAQLYVEADATFWSKSTLISGAQTLGKEQCHNCEADSIPYKQKYNNDRSTQ